MANLLDYAPKDPTGNTLQESLDEVALKKTIETMTILSTNLSAKTKKIAVPRGTRFFYIAEIIGGINPFTRVANPDEFVPLKQRCVEIAPFFGAHVGYDVESDTLIFWEI